MPGPRPPAGLSAPGRQLWRQIAGAFELEPDEVELLRQACRCADEAEDLRAALAAAGPTVTGSTGQVRPNPLYAQLRAHRETLARLLRGLDLPDGKAAAPSAASRRASDAASRRWKMEKHRRASRGTAS